MSMQIPQRLQELVQKGVIEFLQTNSIAQAKPLTQEPQGVEYQWTGIIGLVGELMTGSLAISCRQDLLDKTHPNHTLGMPVGPDDLVDWLGEVSNQMLGRIKNFVIEYGVQFSLSAPSVVHQHVGFDWED